MTGAEGQGSLSPAGTRGPRAPHGRTVIPGASCAARWPGSQLPAPQLQEAGLSCSGSARWAGRGGREGKLGEPAHVCPSHRYHPFLKAHIPTTFLMDEVPKDGQ